MRDSCISQSHGPYCGQTAGWIRIPLGTNYGGRPRPRRYCVRREPKSIHEEGPTSPTFQFSAPFYCGQTVAHRSKMLRSCTNARPKMLMQFDKGLRN